MSRAKRPRLRAPPLWKHNFRTELIGRWLVKSLSCQNSEGDRSHLVGRKQFVSFYCRSSVKDSVRSSGSLDNEIWTLTDWQLTTALSHLTSTELEHMWLIDFKCTSLNFSVIFQLHNYWFFTISQTQCRTSNIELNTGGISALFPWINPFSAVHNHTVAAMPDIFDWISPILHAECFFSPLKCETERLAAWPWSRLQRHIADISMNRCQLPVRWLACGTLDDNL